jgi:trk system potassium uptake protein TrkH
MKFSNRERIARYFDLFVFFIEVDIFVLILFELSYSYRPFVYNTGRILIIIYVLDLIVQFLLNPRLKNHFLNYWHQYASLIALIILYNRFRAVPEANPYIFLYSRIFLGVLELILFVRFITRLDRIRELWGSFRVNPAQAIIMSFATIILLGSFLLYLPYSRPVGTTMPYIDALFTSTSAVCVTGLIVVDTGSAFSLIGKIFLLILIQAGGLGIMTIAAFIQVSTGSEMSLYGRFSTAALLDQSNIRNLYTIIKSIVLITFSFEAVGVLLFFPYMLGKSGGTIEAIFSSFFHSISAFCNAGFSLYSDSFVSARSNIGVNLTLMFLIVSGGIGFTVLLNLLRRIVRGVNERISVQTRLVLLTTAFLILFGAVHIYLLEKDVLFRDYTSTERFLGSFFQSITTRTAGFNTVDISALRPRTLFIMSILMIIGASPGSTGGGIKTTTFFILILSIITILRDQRFNTIFKRRIPYAVVNRAIAILVSAIGVIIFGTLLLSFSEGFTFNQIYFEIVSAFGTVGLSTGITPSLSDFGKIVIILVMFVGRLGPLTLVLAIRNVQGTKLVTYPEERVMVG